MERKREGEREAQRKRQTEGTRNAKARKHATGIVKREEKDRETELNPAATASNSWQKQATTSNSQQQPSTVSRKQQQSSPRGQSLDLALVLPKAILESLSFLGGGQDSQRPHRHAPVHRNTVKFPTSGDPEVGSCSAPQSHDFSACASVSMLLTIWAFPSHVLCRP